MGKDYKPAEQEETNLAYDLRQRRAKIIGDCLDEVVYSAKSGNYYVWLKSIEDLYDISEHAFNEKDDTAKEYKRLKKEVTTLANTYPQVWLKKNNEPTAAAKIEDSLRILFRYLMLRIEDSGIFGRGYVYDEDEI